MKRSMSYKTRLIGKGTVVGCLAALCIALPLQGGEQAAADGPQYTSDGHLKRPTNYREWIFLSSGLGMTYGPTAMQMPMDNPDFDNVFVNRAAYKNFQATGKWPDKTIFILEVRASQSKGSINKGGHFQARGDGHRSARKEREVPGQVGVFWFSERSRYREANCDDGFLLFLPRAARRGGHHVRAVLSHADRDR